jgi:tetratricopeptide (TPR) repeat protein
LIVIRSRLRTPVFCLALVLIAGCTAFSNRRPTPAAPAAADYYLRGMTAYQSGDRDAAIRALTEATRQNPDLAVAHSALGDIYRESANYTAAVTEYQALTRLDPYTADNHHRLGLSYHFLNLLREAAASYLRAIKLNPADWKSNMNLGLVYMALGEYNSAVEHAQRAVNLNPLSPVALANLGVTYDARGNRGEAEGAYRMALNIDPAQTTAAQNLVINLLDRRRPVEAIEACKQALAASDTAALRRRYGDALVQAGRAAEAAEQYRHALRLDADYYPALNGLGAVLIEQFRDGLLLDERKRDDALAAWRQSLQLNPNQPKVEAQLRIWQPKAG